MKTENSGPKNSYQSIDDYLAVMHSRKMNVQIIDEHFEQERERKDTALLVRASRVIITLWELTSLIMRNPGKCLVIDCDSGDMFVGKISREKLQEKFTAIPEKVPGRRSLEIDGNGRNERILAKTGFTPFGKAGFKKNWNYRPHVAPGIVGTFDLYYFEEELKVTPPENVTEEIIPGPMGHEILEISIKGYPTKLGLWKSSGRYLYTKENGIITYFETEK